MDPQGWAWNYTEELLATLAELVDESNRMFYSAHTQKKPSKPIQIRRPWTVDEPKARAKPTHEEIVRFFGGSN